MEKKNENESVEEITEQDVDDAQKEFESLSPELQQQLLQQIQSSMVRSPMFQSKHHRARELRLYHRHFSPKARKRKKDRRRVVRASRQENYRFAKSR